MAAASVAAQRPKVRSVRFTHEELKQLKRVMAARDASLSALIREGLTSIGALGCPEQEVATAR